MTKIGGIGFRNLEEKQADNFRKMLLSVADDLRVVIIKFADRLHNMRTLEHLSAAKAKRIAIETRDVYAPLAHRLGMARVKTELEDLVLKTLEPEAYAELRKKVAGTRRERERYIERVARPIRKRLKETEISAQISGRAKHFYSVYGKMQSRKAPYEEIYDLMGLRIVVERVEDCYGALGIVHSLYSPIQERFKDFIAMPKTNSYRSIHTTVVGPAGRPVEFQIRTTEMDEIAKFGIAAHWRYKEDDSKEGDLDRHVRWLRELIDTLRSETADPKEFMTTLKIDLFKDEIFVFTPAGELKQLPTGATPVDFAYEVHTEVGNHCIGAKVGGKIVPLNTRLKSGDSVEIITSDAQTPNSAWLKFVVTTKARTQVSKWVKRQQLESSINLGKDILSREFKKRRLSKAEKLLEERIGDSKFDSMRDLYAAVGRGDFPVVKVLRMVLPPEKVSAKPSPRRRSLLRRGRGQPRGIRVQGMDNVMINLGNCCRPIPGDSIVGFITKGKGVTIHRADCSDAGNLLSDPDRTVEAVWHTKKKDIFKVQLKILAQERKHFLKDVTECISATNTNILSADLRVEDEMITTHLVIQVRNLKHLESVVNRVGQLRSLVSVERN